MLLCGTGSPRDVPNASACPAGPPAMSLRPLATEMAHGDRPHGFVLHGEPLTGSAAVPTSGRQSDAPAGFVELVFGHPVPPEKTTAMPASCSFFDATFIGSRASQAPPPGP